MAPKPLYETIHRQFEVLVKTFQTHRGLKEFLEKVPIPETTAPLLPDARYVAEMLLAAPTESFAAQELRADEARTRAFFQFAMTQLPNLRDHPDANALVTSDSSGPFAELSEWLLSTIERS